MQPLVRAAALAMLTLTVAVATASAGTPGNNGWIAFDSRRGADADLFRTAPGKPEIRLAASLPGANDSRPAWGPEATMWVRSAEIVTGTIEIDGGGFLQRGRLTSVEVDGVRYEGAAVQVRSDSFATVVLTSTPGADPSVCAAKQVGLAAAPAMVARTHPSDGSGTAANECDSQPLAFQSDRTGDYDVWLYDPASPLGSSNPVNLTSFPGAHDTAPAWSWGRGGSSSLPISPARETPLLAFVSDRFGSRDIFVHDPFQPSGPSNPVRVTTSPGDETNPEWSPNGRYLVFESDMAGPKDLWRITVPDSGPTPNHELRQVTADAEPSFDPTWTSFEGADPNTGGDANAIAFSGPEEEKGDCEINAIQALDRDPPERGDEMTTIPQPASKDDAPSFAPQSWPLAFQSVRAGNEDILLLNRDDTIVRLTGDAGADRHPSWQPLLIFATLDYYRPIGRKSRRKPRASVDARPCSEPPFAAFRFGPVSPRPGEEVVFDAQATSDTDGPLDRFEWDLDGDGTFEARASSPIVRRTFAKGVHEVQLRVVDQDGDASRLRQQVHVGDQTEAPEVCTSLGTPGPDVLAGTPGDDVLCGLGGDDVIYGLAGNDVIRGGPGNDRLFGGDGADVIEGGTGRDWIAGDEGRDRLSGGGGRDRSNGGGGEDVISGGSGDDRLAGGAGADRLLGRSGVDRLFGNASDDRLLGGVGADRLSGGASSDRLAGEGGRDRLSGGPGRDRMSGGPGRDVLRARDGRPDVVSGGRQADVATVDHRLDSVHGVEVIRR